MKSPRRRTQHCLKILRQHQAIVQEVMDDLESRQHPTVDEQSRLDALDDAMHDDNTADDDDPVDVFFDTTTGNLEEDR